jgi:hypothetical protein
MLQQDMELDSGFELDVFAALDMRVVFNLRVLPIVAQARQEKK